MKLIKIGLCYFKIRVVNFWDEKNLRTIWLKKVILMIGSIGFLLSEFVLSIFKSFLFGIIFVVFFSSLTKISWNMSFLYRSPLALPGFGTCLCPLKVIRHIWLRRVLGLSCGTRHMLGSPCVIRHMVG